MSKSTPPPLRDERAWTTDGHLSELALSILTDGEASLLRADARDHAETCMHCAEQIAQLAEVSLVLAEAYKKIAPKKQLTPAVVLFGAVLTVAATMVSGYSFRFENWVHKARTAEKAVPHVARSLAAVSHQYAAVSAALLIAMTAAIVVWVSQRSKRVKS
jgi:hypothetical protein